MFVYVVRESSGGPYGKFFLLGVCSTWENAKEMIALNRKALGQNRELDWVEAGYGMLTAQEKEGDGYYYVNAEEVFTSPKLKSFYGV